METARSVDELPAVADFVREKIRATVTDPAERGRILTDAFLFSGTGPFGPFMNANHLGPDGGQIRTNNFNDFIWTLREFKLVEQDGQVGLVPFPVAESPHGPLWNDSVDSPIGMLPKPTYTGGVPASRNASTCSGE